MKMIDHLLKGREKSIGEETILQPLPHKDFRFASPFIVLHHLPPHQYPPGSPPERIHPHPHRGFAPVTFMFQGEGYHKDSEGNSGVLRAGEVQWMFAGRGLLHSEGPTKELLEKGGTYEFVQIWVNVPARHKMDTPDYQQAAQEEMPCSLMKKA
jgi:quercetin 2,3-dioxygenase